MQENRVTLRTIGACTAVALSIALGVDLAVSVPALAEDGKPDLSLELSIVRGGRLYANWYSEIGARTPTKSHPSYPVDQGYAQSPASTWRCVECHGWDYRGKDGAYSAGAHYTGIKGIHAWDGTERGEVLAVLKDAAHGFGDGMMSERDLEALADFVSTGQVDMDDFIDRKTGEARGDKSKRKAYYQAICADCHGLDGQEIVNVPPLGITARNDPWKALHFILNGHPQEKTPALRVLGRRVLVDILAYVQTLPGKPTLASIVRGGRLYDNWVREIGATTPTESHPAYPVDRRYANAPASTWRCAECHGWDYRGKDGAYSEGAHFTGIKGIRAWDGAERGEVLAVLKDATHGFADGPLRERDLEDLADFVSRGQVDMDKYIDRKTGEARGENTKRKAYYQTICANCHGLDGQDLVTDRCIPPLGDTARNNPWKALHNILYGHSDVSPNASMPSLRVLRRRVVADILAYTQTLPGAKAGITAPASCEDRSRSVARR